MIRVFHGKPILFAVPIRQRQLQRFLLHDRAGHGLHFKRVGGGTLFEFVSPDLGRYAVAIQSVCAGKRVLVRSYGKIGRVPLRQRGFSNQSAIMQDQQSGNVAVSPSLQVILVGPIDPVRRNIVVGESGQRLPRLQTVALPSP